MGQDPDGGPDEAVDVANELQRYAREETRLGVPPLLNVDAVHGHAYATAATAFPNGLGAAATSDTGAVERAASVTAREVRATGAHRNYGPTVDVARDPRWGRVFETFDESPHLVGAFAAAKARGYQGGIGDPSGVVVTTKHFPRTASRSGARTPRPSTSPSTSSGTRSFPRSSGRSTPARPR